MFPGAHAVDHSEASEPVGWAGYEQPDSGYDDYGDDEYPHDDEAEDWRWAVGEH